MLLSSRFFTLTHVAKTLLAFALVYVLLVEGLAARRSFIISDQIGIHALCLTNATDTTSGERNETQDKGHDGHLPCCLNFGSSDLPSPVRLISTFIFTIYPFALPATEFLRRPDKRLTYLRSPPRAPPHMG